MARAKKKAPVKGKPRPKAARVRGSVTFLRSTEEWKAAVERFAEWDRATTVTELVDRAVASYARERGYPEPIPRR
jgi:hypothetical protein